MQTRQKTSQSAGATAGAQATQAQAQMIDSESETTEVRAQMIDGTSDVAIAWSSYFLGNVCRDVYRNVGKKNTFYTKI
jgi:hypothetical protein